MEGGEDIMVSTPGTGFRLQDGKIEAHGLTHTFGGTMMISDGNFMVVIGKYLTATGLTKRYPWNNDTNLTADGQIHIYKWSGSAWVENSSIGLKTGGGDDRVIDVNVTGAINGITSTSSGGRGILGVGVVGVEGYVNGTDRVGVMGTALAGSGTDGYGGSFFGGKAPIKMNPSDSASAPSHSASKGSVWLTSACVMYVNTDGGTTWQKVGAQ
jgi:hypothetical protein